MDNLVISATLIAIIALFFNQFWILIPLVIAYLYTPLLNSLNSPHQHVAQTKNVFIQKLVDQSALPDAVTRTISIRGQKPSNRTITRLIIHPVKSCKGIEVDEMFIDKTGPAMDRHWCIVQEKEGTWSFLTAREYPKLLAIETGLEFDYSTPVGLGRYEQGGYLTLRHEAKELRIRFPRKPDVTRKFTLWSDSLNGLDEGDEAANFFSNILGTKVRLVVHPPSATRPTDVTYTASMWNALDKREQQLNVVPQTAFADGFPLLLISEKSIQQIDEWMQDQLSVVYKRFRPNILVDGKVPFEEDLYVKVLVGNDVELHGLKPCSRCIMPSIDPDEPETPPFHPLTKTLVAKRRGLIKQHSYVGMNMGFGPSAIGKIIRVGDLVHVSDWGLVRNEKLWTGFETLQDKSDLHQVLTMIKDLQ